MESKPQPLRGLARKEENRREEQSMKTMKKRIVALLLGVALVGQATASFAEGNAK